MKFLVSSVVLGALALSGVFLSADAQACGGCFHIIQSESGQVTGHRMIFSVSNDKTTLWDQISYDGNPESFAWVLPIHGEVDIGLSSDALFEQLDSMTSLYISSPDINCGPTTCPDSNANGGSTFTSSQTGTTTSSVTVIAEETVGPFETVQLASADPAALQTWLADHGYVIPADVVPIIDAYVNEGFDFLAMRLAPGENVNSMQPVRVTSPGAGLTLPLRMVAAGTGAMTPITLWVLGEGRYEPANFPSFVIPPEDLVWNWDTQKSNYTDLKMAGFAAAQGAGWLVENASPQYSGNIGGSLEYLVEYEPAASGYGDTPEEAMVALAEDLDALYGTIDENSLWVTRLHGQLSKAALATDLDLGAATDQSIVTSEYYVTDTVGTPPECPPPPDCGDGGGGNGSGANGSGANGSGANGVGLWTPGGGDGGSGANNGDGGSSEGGSGGCSVGGSAPAFGALLAALGMAAALRRRRRSQG